MPNTTQEKLYETFVAISGGQLSSQDPMIDASEDLVSSVAKIAKAMDRVATPTAGNAASVTPADPRVFAAPVARPVAAAVVPAAATESSMTTASSTNTPGSLATTLLQNVFGA